MQVVSNTNYQPDAALMAKADIFKTAPEAATMTGQVVAGGPKEQMKDGNVDIMHTEWIDLKRASEKMASKEGVSNQVLNTPVPQQNPSTRGWAAAGQLR